MNNRRELMVALGASALAASFWIYAQPAKKSVAVGILAVQDQPSAESPHSAGRCRPGGALTWDKIGLTTFG